MIKRLVAIVITIIFVSIVVCYFYKQIDWQKLATINYSLGATSVPTFLPPERLTLMVVGDIMLDRGVALSVKNHGAGDYKFIFSKLSNLKEGSDYLIGNLEGPVAYGGSDMRNTYSFHMSPEVLPALKSVGFDALSVANNHAADWGRSAFEETLANLSKNKIYFTGGAYSYASATEPVILTKGNLKLGLLGFSDVGPGALVAGGESGVLSVSDGDFDSIIKEAKEKVDVLVVFIHWGDEYQPKHNSRQAELAHRAINDGAKVVLGHHPHVIQDEEYYRGGYIAYSLGNFVFDQYFSKETMQGLALKLEINKDGVGRIEKKLIELNKWFQPSWATSSISFI